ncbi:MAG: hypothetical protein HKN33_18145 [Pyrinomonadaceae bacterium]|nr:hypothetical protein [Pyrinomonadaceae bacterium]
MGSDKANERRRRFKRDERELREIVNGWELIPGTPDDEFDCLVHHLLSWLGSEKKEREIVVALSDELESHFGFSRVSKRDTGKMVNSVCEWWGSRDEIATN